MKRIVALAFICLLLPLASFGQENPKVFYVNSWKKGERKIREQKFVIELNQTNPKFKTRIYDASGKARYKLSISHHPIKKGSNLYEYWWIDLSEIGSRRNSKLLSVEGPGPPGDNFPKEDNIGWLYPLEDPKIFTDFVSAYPILAKRVIKVEGFYCIIRVTNYTMPSSNPKAVESLTVEIEFTNNYESPNAAA
jgi:hypothetical protein